MLKFFFTNIPKQKFNIGLIVNITISFIFFLIFFKICLFRYNSLQYHDWDFSLFANGLWNIVHGNFSISVYGRLFLANHFNLFAFILAPIYFIFQTPITLLFFKILALSLTSIPIYLIAKKYFSQQNSVLFSIIYLLYPSLLYVILYEFHFEDFAPLFLTIIFYSLINRKNIFAIIFTLLAISCKENIPLVSASIGIYAIIFIKKQRKIGFIIFLLSSLYFLLVTLYLQPMCTASAGKNIGYASHYSQYGKGFLNVFIYIATHPITIIKDLFSTKLKINFFKNIFSPLGYLPLLRPDILIIIFPTILKNLLSKVPTTHTIYWQYTSTIIPFLVISTIFSLKWICSKIKFLKKYIIFILIFIIINEIILSLNFYKKSHYFVRYDKKNTINEIKKTAIKLIPKNASVICTFDFLPKLSQRKNIFTFYMLWRHRLKYKNFSSVEYAIIDFNDYFVEKDFLYQSELISNMFSQYLLNPEWSVKYEKSDIIVLKKEKTPKTTNLIKILENNNNN